MFWIKTKVTIYGELGNSTNEGISTKLKWESVWRCVSITRDKEAS